LTSLAPFWVDTVGKILQFSTSVLNTYGSSIVAKIGAFNTNLWLKKDIGRLADFVCRMASNRSCDQFIVLDLIRHTLARLARSPTKPLRALSDTVLQLKFATPVLDRLQGEALRGVLILA
jgi:hypothetical protein